VAPRALDQIADQEPAAGSPVGLEDHAAANTAGAQVERPSCLPSSTHIGPLSLKASTLTPILTENIARESRVMTDEAAYYNRLKDQFADHEFVQHGAEDWARGEVHTNTLEGFFSIFTGIPRIPASEGRL
jgi:ISXO2-like transposase domain